MAKYLEFKGRQNLYPSLHDTVDKIKILKEKFEKDPMLFKRMERFPKDVAFNDPAFQEAFSSVVELKRAMEMSKQEDIENLDDADKKIAELLEKELDIKLSSIPSLDALSRSTANENVRLNSEILGDFLVSIAFESPGLSKFLQNFGIAKGCECYNNHKRNAKAASRSSVFI